MEEARFDREKRTGARRSRGILSRTKPSKKAPPRGAKIASRSGSYPLPRSSRSPAGGARPANTAASASVSSPPPRPEPRSRRSTPGNRPTDEDSMAHEKRPVKANRSLSSTAEPRGDSSRASKPTKKEPRMAKSKSSAAVKVSATDAAPESVAPPADYAQDFGEDEARGGREEPNGPELAVVSPDEEFGVEAARRAGRPRASGPPSSSRSRRPSRRRRKRSRRGAATPCSPGTSARWRRTPSWGRKKS